MFDDVFSGLDKVTEQAVFSRVFGRDGLLRKNGTTIILATHAGKYLAVRSKINVLIRFSSSIARVRLCHCSRQRG
jgi:ABC-type uncharacterized transport system ATPase subunit